MTAPADAPAPGIGLRWRIVALSALVAILSVSLCGIFAAAAVRKGLEDQAKDERERAVNSLERQIADLTERIGYEVGDYADWTELYEQMPRPDPAWAKVNLIAGRDASLVQHFILVADGAIVGRYHAGSAHDAKPRPEDPADPADLLALVGTWPPQGLARLGGRIALACVRPIRDSARELPPRGHLIGLTYLDSTRLKRLYLDGWDVRITVGDTATPPSAVAFPAIDGGRIDILLNLTSTAANRIALGTNDAIAIGGLVCVAIAGLIGMLLGLHWIRPLSAIAEAARRRAEHPDEPLPDSGGLREAAELRRALDDYAQAEQRHREALATALDREAVANAVHRRFLAHLAQEIGTPVERIAVVLENLGKGIAVDAEILERVRLDALRLEERLHEALGLAAEIHSQEPRGGIPSQIGSYLAGVAEALDPLCSRLGRQVTVDADPGETPIQVSLLTPILVNLAANALHAPGTGPVILSCRMLPDDSTVWRVSDPGPGLDPGLRQSIAEAFARGEVVPGTPGIGLGLAVVISNARALKARLELERSDGSGTTVAIHVPAQDAGFDYRTISSGTARFRRRHEH